MWLRVLLIRQFLRNCVDRWSAALSSIYLESCSHRVIQVVSQWVSMAKKDKIGQMYQDNLKKLLDLRPVSCSTLPTLTTELQKLQGNDWEEDYDFFKGQRKYPSLRRLYLNMKSRRHEIKADWSGPP